MADTDNRHVIDASVILAGLFHEEVFNIAADRILEAYRQNQIHLSAPTILTYEVVNGIRSAVLRKRIAESAMDTFVREFKMLEIDLISPDELNVLHTAVSHGFSVYDSAYVSLASSQKLPLLTADRKLYDILIHQNIDEVIWLENFH